MTIFENLPRVDNHDQDYHHDDDLDDGDIMIRLDLDDKFNFPRDFIWYADRCFECKLPLTRFWIEEGSGKNNLRGGFLPQVIIKSECLYFHNTQDREFYQLKVDLSDSFSQIVEDGAPDDDSNGYEDGKHSDDDDDH